MTSAARPAPRRWAGRLGSLVAVAALMLATWCSTAVADDSGEVNNLSPASTGDILLRLVIVPLVLVVIIGLLAAAPRLLRRPRYRPGTPWPHDPLWFAGPDRPEAALARSRPARGTGGAGAEW